MFIQLESRRRPPPTWATLLLVGVCVAMFLWIAAEPASGRGAPADGLGHGANDLARYHRRRGRSSLPSCALRAWSRRLFIHADWIHLTTNLLFLIIFGVPTERALGAGRFLVLFVIGGALANLVGALTLAATNSPIIGSSGAVSSVVGAYLALYPRARLGLVLPLGFFLEFVRVPASLLIGFWAVLQILFTYVGPAFGAVAWWTHIAGFLLGIVFALLWRPGIARRARH